MDAAKSLMPPRAGTEAVTLIGRLGYAAPAVVYFLVGASAATASLWPEHRPAGPSDAVEIGHGHPIGDLLARRCTRSRLPRRLVHRRGAHDRETGQRTRLVAWARHARRRGRLRRLHDRCRWH